LFLVKATYIASYRLSVGVVGGRRGAVRIIERLPEHYEEQEMVYGRAYKWCPETIVIQCECGEELTFERSDLLIGSARTCECGKDHIGGIREEVQDKVIGDLFEDDERVHPWRYWYTTKDTGIPF
jgi:hypothetical protein